MATLLLVVELIFTIIIGSYFFVLLKEHRSSERISSSEDKDEMKELLKLKKIKLTIPLTEKGRPQCFEEIIGQEQGIKALKAAICGPNPQNVIIYGPPGIGKTAAARLVLEYAKKLEHSPFNDYSSFIEIDATTVRFDDRGIADPLIGSVHDPIYQGAGALGAIGVPEPKPGAVTRAHGGILFIDEIGELHPIELNKLLKVLEDRKVFLDSSYYNSNDKKMPKYIRDIFENGLPADFRLIGATTRSPEELCPAIRSRCVEIFFRQLDEVELEAIALKAVEKVKVKIEKPALKLIAEYSSSGRDAVNLVQLAYGIVINENKNNITVDEVEWIIENGQYSPKIRKKISDRPEIGCVNGIAIYGANIGAIMELEATAKKNVKGQGKLKVTGIVEEEEIKNGSSKIFRKSNAKCSAENAITMLENVFNLSCEEYDIHVNFPGGIPIDGPSAGITIATVIYSALKGKAVNNKVAMTGEISLYGRVKAVGGVNVKVSAAIKAGAKIIIIPKENWKDKFNDIKEAKIVAVNNINEVFKIAFTKEMCENSDIIVNNAAQMLLAKK